MRNHDDFAETAPVRWRGDLLLLTLFFGVLTLFAAGRLPLKNPDEPRYAGIAREMIATGDWVTPRLNDTRYFEKPPLVPWLVALSRLAFGPGDAAARLPSVVFGVGGVLLVYALGRRLFGREAGLAAAFVLGTSLLYFALSWLLLLDMVLSVTLSAALICFLLGVREPPGPRRRGLFLGLYVSAALATLAKGLIGFLLPGAIMALWLLVLNQWHRLRPLYLPSGCALFLLVAAPWHVLVAQRNPEWAAFYFGHEHWARFTTTVHGRAEPFWFFVPVLVVGLFPWIGFLPSAVRTALAGGWARRKENADAWFLVLWAAFVFLFFSRSQSKLIPYLLPAFPPLAVLIGAWLARCWSDGGAARLRPGLGVFSFGCGLLGIAFLAAVFRPGIVRDAEQMAALRPFGVALAAVLLLGGVAAPWAAKMRGVVAGVGTVLATMAGFFLVAMTAGPGWQRASTRDLALVARERIAPEDRVYHYWGFFHDFVYYAERPVGLVSYTDELEVQFLDPAEKARRFIDDAELRRQWAGPGRIWLVVRKRAQAAPESVFADPAFRPHVIAESRTHQLVSNRP
ncbi:MAG: glycosyltransferase family 39 protein [Opitutaceae bacterium]|nr:glycosyltransferase family 39 protein [Opitutaceae bacterium]